MFIVFQRFLMLLSVFVSSTTILFAGDIAYLMKIINNYTDSVISVIDVTDQKEISTISIPSKIVGPILIPREGSLGYLLESSLESISVIDLVSHTLTETFPLDIPDSNLLRGTGISPDGSTIYMVAGAGSSNSHKLLTMDTKNKNVDQFPLSSYQDIPYAVFNSDCSVAYLAYYDSSNIYVDVFDMSKKEKSRTITLNSSTSFSRMFLSPDDSYLYILPFKTNQLYYTDLRESSQFEESLNFSFSPTDIGFNPEKGWLYGSGDYQDICIYDMNNKQWLDPISGSYHLSGFSSDYHYLYAREHLGSKEKIGLSFINTENVADIQRILLEGSFFSLSSFSSRKHPTPPTPPQPPSGGNSQDFSDGLSVYGRSKKSDFLSESDIFNEIRWSLSINKVPSHYKIFRDGVLIATIPAENKPVFQDHNLKAGRTYEYIVVAEDESGFIANGGYAIKTKK